MAGRAAAVADGFGDAIEQSGLKEAASNAITQTGRMGRLATKQRRRFDRRVERIRDKTETVIDKTAKGAHAVAETGRRAVAAPPHVLDDVREAGKAWMAGMLAGAALYAGAWIAALIALAAFSIGFAAGLNLWLGSPWGTFIVAALYAVGAAILVTMARRQQGRGTEEARQHMHDAQQELRAVVQPIKDALHEETHP